MAGRGRMAMKLRNKKTGEIIKDAQYRNYSTRDGFVITTPTDKYSYKSLKEFCEDWEDVPEEEWRDVLGFEELYQVSNLGNVRTVKRGEATVMSQKEHWNGYLSVHLRNKGVERRASVHRLVAEAFIPNPDGLRDVNHKNGIKTDNRVENLEWLSHSDNMKHQYQVLKTGRYGHLYKPAEPRIDNKEIREIIRAWADVNDAGKLKYNDDENSLNDIYRNSITFNRGLGLEDGHSYTISELCREE